MREETKEKIIKALEIAKTIVHWGFIPAILYLGFTRSHPKPSLISYLIVQSLLEELSTSIKGETVESIIDEEENNKNSQPKNLSNLYQKA
ncbi:5547_t:CDS:2 [Diversispora eburnea]|uniref:5547_t:CDS:1 n=1 Tax=Diversispora eburnea TaxID=1213867 RepID=A0A9N8V2L1_9GLOM|nr:5547_t:CDS:2 [Diversispora eburnea]